MAQHRGGYRTESMETLALKLVLTPTLIGAMNLAGRKWGAAVSGWLVGLPLTSGPVALFLALEQGKSFASRAALGILFGLISIAVFSLAYSWLAFRLNWPLALLAGWLGFFVATFFLQRMSLALLPAFVGVVIALAVTLWRMSAKNVPAVDTTLPRRDVPARMVIATTFVLLLTGLADVLGARLGGLLAPFPIFCSILAEFTHVFRARPPHRVSCIDCRPVYGCGGGSWLGHRLRRQQDSGERKTHAWRRCGVPHPQARPYHITFASKATSAPTGRNGSRA